ncbi:hypothetical protein BHE90_016006 [Fusarium euwallaceae]|uniref:Uncharacterized protein n=1 Tax=Fusarium euwallaceae TaxID=1147111 RepID=A0A430L1H9_9HYPO|nr:hypothetical protein BHE90_016006 [Fusarium euwallaceae]
MERLSSEVLSMIMEHCDLPGLIALTSLCGRFRGVGWPKLLRGQFPASSTVPVILAIVSTYEDPEICLSLLRKAMDNESKATQVQQSITFNPKSKSFEWVHQTALHMAVSRGLTPVVDFLLEKGVPHGRPTTDSRTVLEAAVYANKLDIVRNLIDRISISKEDQNNAIYAAVAIGSKDMLGLFLSKGWDLGPNGQTHVFEAALDSPLGVYKQMIPHLRAHGVQITEDAFVRMWDAFIEGGSLLPLWLHSDRRPAAIPSFLQFEMSLLDVIEDQEMIYAGDTLTSIRTSNPGVLDHVIPEKIRQGFFIRPEAMVSLIKGDETLRRNVWHEMRRMAARFAAGPEGMGQIRDEMPRALEAFQILRDHFYHEWIGREIALFPKLFVTSVDSLIATGFELSFTGLEKKLFQVPH